jgi:hypothetical protein
MRRAEVGGCRLAGIPGRGCHSERVMGCEKGRRERELAVSPQIHSQADCFSLLHMRASCQAA